MQIAPFLLLPGAWAVIKLVMPDLGIQDAIPVYREIWYVPSVRSLAGRALQALAQYDPSDYGGWLFTDASEAELKQEWKTYRRPMGMTMFRMLQLHRQPWLVRPTPDWLKIDWSDQQWNEVVEFDRCPPAFWYPLAEGIFQRLPLWRAIQWLNRDGFLDMVMEADRLDAKLNEMHLKTISKKELDGDKPTLKPKTPLGRREPPREKVRNVCLTVFSLQS